DYNLNGIKDPGEPGLSHWKIFLDHNRNGTADSDEPVSVTDADGNYMFAGLAPGTYNVAEELQEGWQQTRPGSRAAAETATLPLTTRFAELTLAERKEIFSMVFDSPPHPAAGFRNSALRADTVAGVLLSEVPTSTWTYGCSATAAGMLFGYYDRIGYSNMYAGPANNGVAPLVDLGQGFNPDSPIAGSCSLIATMQGFDGRTVPGHVDDYWRALNENGPDPWSATGSEHSWGECTADFLGTNQWKWNFDSVAGIESNNDGSTTYFYYGDGRKLYDPVPDPEQGRPATALCHGLRLFAESRGYQVVENYNQLIDARVAGGFSFAEYKNEIDNGRPVLVHVTGHTMIGVGYDDSGSARTVYLHDTWSNSLNSMPWGGSYDNRTFKAVTVFRLAPLRTAPGEYEVTLAEGEMVKDVNFGNHGPDQNGNVRLMFRCGSDPGDLCYGSYATSIAEVYADSGNDDEIQVQIGNYSENLHFDRPLSIRLEGGYSAGFTKRTGFTNLIGSLTISSGQVAVGRLIIQ
ncbi:MAG: hypothetical protein GXO34_01670, partial [Deltaproteobacteria bacterium]|nr:hypothetical protein [Deltaproteobacteria bacterium]